MNRNIAQILTLSSFGIVCWAVNANAQEELKDLQKEYKKHEAKMFVFRRATWDAQFIEQLDIVPNQQKLIKEISEQYSDDVGRMTMRFEKQFYEMRNNPTLSNEEIEREINKIRIERIKEWTNLVKAANQEIEANLQPHQFKRLRQLAKIQEIVIFSKTKGIMALKVISKELGLSEQEQNNYAKKIDVLQSEFESERAKLRKKYENKVVNDLPPEARKKLRELIGEFFYFENLF